VVDELRHRLIDQGFQGFDRDNGRHGPVRLLVEHGTVTTVDLGLA